MQLYKIVSGAAVACTLAVTPVVQAADPAEKCGKAVITGNDTLVVYRYARDAFLAGCKGKSPAEVDAKLVSKVNKQIEKANNVDEKLDCNTNGDPEVVGDAPFPLPPVPAGTFSSFVEIGEGVCNGVDDTP